MRQDGYEGNALTYQTALNSLKRFANADKIDIKEINSIFLLRYMDYLKTEPNQCNIRAKNRKLLKKGDSACSAYLRSIRAIFNCARKKYNDEDAGIIRIPHYPFGKIKIKDVPRKPREALTVEEFQALLDLPKKDDLYNLAKEVFVLSFCLFGTSSIDLYECNIYKNGRIVYNRAKTTSRRKDKAEIKVLIPSEAMSLLEK
jgi:integrase